MKDFYLVNFSVKGIKTIDELLSLSFYKKTIDKDFDTRKYNIKGIYGMNGSGKSGIVTAVEILRNILINPNYLNNPIVQTNLDAIINKKTEKLYMSVDFVCGTETMRFYYRYELKLEKDMSDKFVISYEKLSTKKVNSKKETMVPVFEIENGEVVSRLEYDNDELADTLFRKTTNLLETASLSALFHDKILPIILENKEKMNGWFSACICMLFLFGNKLFVYLDQSDDHREYIMTNTIKYEWKNTRDVGSLVDDYINLDTDYLDLILSSDNIVSKTKYDGFQENVRGLYRFLKIFKSELQDIEIDRKENQNVYICNLIMVYGAYKIHAEYESTGVKKLIKLYAYLKEMAEGGIVFIDEFDSNLHDVYLCALLEYLMEYGEGQLCFTTHNVGPMDILKRNKKSIDFLSVDHKIYPWKSNGNYSPSKLYRNGMIEGSPFNVDATDFIGVFGLDEEADA